MTGIFFLLNFIQSLTEFLPISSSGHLLITTYLYNISDAGLEAFLHLPTALAIAFVFWQSLLFIFKERRTWIMLLAAIIPAALIGFLLGDYIDTLFYTPFIIALNQIVWGGVLLYTSIKPQAKATVTSWKQLTPMQSLKIGLLQSVALIPGTSRSGITTLAGIWQGLSPSESASFSFISGFPLIIAASGIGFLKLIKDTTILNTLSVPVILAGMLMSFVLGVLFVKLFTSKHTLLVMKYSGIYRIILGIFIFIWLL